MHLFLDLDETCISSIDYNLPQIANLSYFIVEDETNKPIFKTYKRPHLDEFLLWAFENYNVSFWSAGEKTYVLDILSNIIPPNCSPKIVLWREHCDQCEAETGCLKSLQWLSTKLPIDSFGKPILIDDLKENINCNPNNSILISKFEASEASVQDDVLKNVQQTIVKMDGKNFSNIQPQLIYL
jgi:TFIIF-interacting CTD phosphatase-like protein